MRLFLDTNVLLDIVLERQGHVESQAVVQAVIHGHEFFIAWHSLGTIFYVARKSKGKAAAMKFLNETVAWATVASVRHKDALHSLALSFTDYEDAMQAVAAEACAADLIITRNLVDFKTSSVPAMAPEEFLTTYHPKPAP